MIPIFERIKTFNQMYGLPTPGVPTLPPPEDLKVRMSQFQKMLDKEMDEGDDVITDDTLETLVNYADWLGDICVYCMSEARRFGIPLDHVLDIIMDSNASKLDVNGQPIIIEGKIQKGPFYWKPEPRIAELIRAFTLLGDRK